MSTPSPNQEAGRGSPTTELGAGTVLTRAPAGHRVEIDYNQYLGIIQMAQQLGLPNPTICYNQL